MLDDVSTYYNNDSEEPLRYGYKRKKVDHVFACRSCKTMLTCDDVAIDDMFCCIECKMEFYKSEDEE